MKTPNDLQETVERFRQGNQESFDKIYELSYVKGTRSSLLLTYSRHKLRQGTDYETPSYDESSLKKNKIKVTITGKGDFTGSVTKTIKVQ